MADGCMSFPMATDKEAVFENRMRFFAKEGLPAERLVTFFTEHRDDITLMYDMPKGLNALRGERLAVTDAIISRVPNAGVFLTFADCVPKKLHWLMHYSSKKTSKIQARNSLQWKG